MSDALLSRFPAFIALLLTKNKQINFPAHVNDANRLSRGGGTGGGGPFRGVDFDYVHRRFFFTKNINGNCLGSSKRRVLLHSQHSIHWPRSMPSQAYVSLPSGLFSHFRTNSRATLNCSSKCHYKFAGARCERFAITR